VYHKSTPSVPAIQAADKHELLSLRGVAYYVHVQDMLDRQTHTPEGGGTQLRVDPMLTDRSCASYLGIAPSSVAGSDSG